MTPCFVDWRIREPFLHEVPYMPATKPSEVCPVCQGKGTVTYVDEEVCCQVEIPCWACADSSETALGQPLPGSAWPG